MASKMEPTWEQNYVPYATLKRLLSTMRKLGGSIDPASSTPAAVADRDQLQSINQSFIAQLEQVSTTCLSAVLTYILDMFCARSTSNACAWRMHGFTVWQALRVVNTFVRNKSTTLATLKRNHLQSRQSNSKLEDIKEHIEKDRALWSENNSLREFAELNYTAFFKITKKHVKCVRALPADVSTLLPQRNLVSTFMAKVESQSFMRILSNERYVATATTPFAADPAFSSRTDCLVGDSPLEEPALEPNSIKRHKKRLRLELLSAFTLVNGALRDIVPASLLSTEELVQSSASFHALYSHAMGEIQASTAVRTHAVQSTSSLGRL